MIEIRRTTVFNIWLAKLRDRQARVKIATRLDRLEEGNPGASRSVGAGIVEMKIDFGPGYRLLRAEMSYYDRASLWRR